MAKKYEFEFIGQASFYSDKERNVKMYFSEPENGVNEETGVLLIMAGYGGLSNSKVYKKMRDLFADQYNLITLQCDYFGCEFMQGPNNQKLYLEWYRNNMPKQTFDDFVLKMKRGEGKEYFHRYGAKFKEILDESIDNYNDQGIIQAIDNLDALKILVDILDLNGLNFNKKRIISLGHSHGAYIAYLCNLFQPKVFSAIIDNSAYLYPHYIDKGRVLNYVTQYNCEIFFLYFISSMTIDNELYDLNQQYKDFDNKATIVSFHGIEDNFISSSKKKEFLEKVPNTILEVIDGSGLNDIFRSCGHGLDTDFIKFFDYVWNKYLYQNENSTELEFIEKYIKTSTNTYKIDNSFGVSRIIIEPLKS